MTENKPIDVAAEVQSQGQQTQAVVVREQGGAVGYAMSIDELHRNLQFVRDVMKQEMRENQDYGKIPGTGEKPTLLQPGAQKLLMTFNLVEKVKHEVLRDFPNMHREYEFTLTVCALNGKEWDGVGTCSTLEAKYRYRKAERKCPTCGKHTIIAGKEEYGGGWVCFKKKGGCGAKFAHNDQSIVSQSVGRVEHDNPPDYWNTVRKMAFKRALVHAAINATNTSELWTQDLEEIAGSEPEEPPQPPTPSTGKGEPTQDDWNAAKPQARQATPQKPVSAPANGNPKVAQCATAEQKAKLLDVLAPQKELAERYMRAIDWLLPTESIESLDLVYVPSTKKQFDALVAQLDAVARGEIAVAPYPPNQRPLAPEKPKKAPEAPPQEPAPTIDPSWQVAEGVIENVNLKEGKKKDGTGWSLWGIKLGGEWHNSFSNRIGHFARDAHRAKQPVKLYYTLDKDNRREAQEIL